MTTLAVLQLFQVHSQLVTWGQVEGSRGVRLRWVCSLVMRSLPNTSRHGQQSKTCGICRLESGQLVLVGDVTW